MTVVNKKGHADWADLKGKNIRFLFYADWDDEPWRIQMVFDRTEPYFEDPRYPRYYVWGDGDVDTLSGRVMLWKWGFLTELGMVRQMFPLPKVSRVTVVSEDGVEFERYNLYENGVEIHLQDDGRTLKIFPRVTS